MDDANCEIHLPQPTAIIERPISHPCRSDGSLPDGYFGDQPFIPSDMPLAHLVNTYWQHGYADLQLCIMNILAN